MISHEMKNRVMVVRLDLRKSFNFIWFFILLSHLHAYHSHKRTKKNYTHIVDYCLFASFYVLVLCTHLIIYIIFLLSRISTAAVMQNKYKREEKSFYHNKKLDYT